MFTSALPPSPALSVCDSLADVDDLDAFLNAQGPLTRWATPPPKTVAHVDITECDELSLSDAEPDDITEYDDEYYERVAQHFARKVNNDQNVCPEAVALVRDILAIASLPLDLLGLSFSILSAYSLQRPVEENSNHPAQMALQIVSAMALSDIYTADGPMHSKWWASEVMGGGVTCQDIEKCMRRMLVALDWNIHRICSPEALSQALTDLSQSTQLDLLPTSLSPSQPLPIICKDTPLRLQILEDTARWAHGQMTPADTPTSVDVGNDSHRFLPLL